MNDLPEPEIPGMPSDDHFRKTVLARVKDDVADMPTANSGRGEQARSDPSSKMFNIAHRARPDDRPAPSPERLRALHRQAKLLLGPGQHADPYQQELWWQKLEDQKLSRKIEDLSNQLNDVLRYDPVRDERGNVVLGEAQPVYKIDGQVRKSLEAERADAMARLESLHGAGGLRRREQALQEAIEHERKLFVRQWTENEAQRRAAQMVLDKKISERAELLAKQRGGEE